VTESTDRSPPDGDRVAAAVGATWAELADGLEMGWSRQEAGVWSLVTGMPIPSMNGVWAVSAEAGREAIDRGLAAVAEEGVPFCLQVRPGRGTLGAELADAYGMTVQPDIPLMATSMPVSGPVPDGLLLRELAPEEAGLHCALAGPGFGLPPALLAQLITPNVLARANVHGCIGTLGDVLLVTAMSVSAGPAIGLFNVVTPEAHRRRGYGAAITAQAARIGFEGEAEFAWLQSSEAGYGVYERLGFATLERWPYWTVGA
jgi:hypothetical protein